MKSILRSKLFITLITALVCAAVIIAALPREPKLLEVATPTKIPIREFPPACGFCNWEENRTWLSETEVAIAQGEINVYGGRKPVDARLTILDVQNGTKVAVDARFPRPAGDTENFPAISPDGTRVLWKDESGTHIGDLATGRRLDWPGRIGSRNLGNYWFAGGRSWIQWDTMPDHVTVFDSARPGQGVRYSFQRHGSDDNANRYSNPFMAGSDFIIVTRQGKSSTMFLEYVLQAQQRRLALLCTRTANPPAGYDICYCAVSPAGDRVAWVLVRTGQNSAMETLQRLLHRTTQQAGVSESIWTSTPDGQDWREIGYLRTKLELPAGSDDIYELAWVPGGKRLAFDYNNRIYTVRVSY